MISKAVVKGMKGCSLSGFPRTVKAVRTALFAGLIVALLAACNSAPKRDMEYAAVPPADIPPLPEGNGSIYQAGFERSWFENVRARRVGDILVVNLVEDTEAKHTNSGTVSRDSNTSITNPTLFGREISFDLGTSMGSNTDFSGDADNTQNNEFTGSVSVMVTELLSNGYMKVRGEKRIGMTGGNEYVKVSGIIRPEDIDLNNTVDSTKVADATLVYIGDGQTAKATQMGWLAKFFISAIMPF